MDVNDSRASLDFVRPIVAEDLQAGKWGGRVLTRFPALLSRFDALPPLFG